MRQHRFLLACYEGDLVKLIEKQHLFVRLLPKLLDFAVNLADKNGWFVTEGDAFRDPRVHGEYGVKQSYSGANSNHKLRLAIDINLISDGVLLGAEAHEELGKYWKKLHPLCEWGGEPGRNDANHYSLNHNDSW